MKRLFTRLQPTGSKPPVPGSPAPLTAHASLSGLTDHGTATTAIGLQPSLLLPPIPHPHPYEHIAIVATDEGLVMRPHLPGLSHTVSYVRVSWNKRPKVQELHDGLSDTSIDWKSSVIVYGLVGIVELFNASYLLVITSRSYLGCFYLVKSVQAIPLVKDRAQHLLRTIARCSPSHGDLALSSQTGQPASNVRANFAHEPNSVKTNNAVVDTDQPEGTLSSLPSSGRSTPTSLSESLPDPSAPPARPFADKASFWARLSKRQPTSAQESVEGSDEYESLGSITQKGQEESTAVIDTVASATSPNPSEAHFVELEDRVVRECIRQYTKGCMYFAYHFDVTRTFQNKQDQFLRSRTEESLLSELNALPLNPLVKHPDLEADPFAEPFSTLPLWRRVKREFWWNEWLSKPFMDAGMHPYVLPIVQGHFQISSFDLPTKSGTVVDESISRVDYLIASRRSRYRAGLRYQRRGIDEEAHVANFVETETVMRIRRSEMENIFCFVQIRGSVPLYWTQSGYSMKPPPVLSPECTSEQNSEVMKRHFQRTVPIYGPHTIVNLAEQRGKESALTRAYKSYAKQMENKDIRYHEYDFHHETRGMKYENISKLISDLERTFESQGYFWISDNVMLSKQKGIFRVNCIDCLDRTNVVQSAFARHVLEMQLEAIGLIVEPHNGRSEMDVVFNDVWANNGDAISRAYAGTSALKGDFTRTGKRDLGGLLNDGVNSLARMYSSTFSDWFCQAVIDFMLGYRTTAVFSEFLLKLQSTDPRELIRLSRIRAEAIATSVSRILEEGEPLLGGWTLMAPEQLNIKIGDKFEEKILLLSARALYIVNYDYRLEKVKLYTRVPLGMITNVTKGAYILFPLEEAGRDPIQNAGFSVTWLNTDLISSRMTSYSYRNNPVDVSTHPGSSGAGAQHGTLTPGNPEDALANNVLSRMVHARVPSKPETSSDRAGSNDTSFAAFKALPIGSTHVQNGSRYMEPADDLVSAASCQEAVDLIVDAIRRACEEVGSACGDGFIAEEDIVSVLEAQRATSLYAKMEYGVKRLLWLGG